MPTSLHVLRDSAVRRVQELGGVSGETNDANSPAFNNALAGTSLDGAPLVKHANVEAVVALADMLGIPAQYAADHGPDVLPDEIVLSKDQAMGLVAGVFCLGALTATEAYR